MSLAEDLALEAISCLDETFTLELGTVPAPGPWVRHGRCRAVPSSVFFPERGDSADAAKDVCARCPVIDACREYAIAAGQVLVGVWGGTTGRQRRQIRAERARDSAAPVEVVEISTRRPAAAAGTMYRLLEELTGHRDRWARLAEYSSKHSASAIASLLRSGARPSPPGRWEFEGRVVEGGSAVYARFLGAEDEVVAS